MTPPRHALLHEMLCTAGRDAAAAWSPSMFVDQKGDGTPVTRADVAADRSIRAFLAEHFPGDAIASEELGGQLGTGPTWLVDPIDGTSCFVEGLAHWGPTVARVVPGRDGWAVDCAGLYLPRVDEYYFVEAGTGWFGGAILPQLSSRQAPRSLYLPSRFHAYAELQSRNKGRNVGGTAAHLALVARGAAEAAIVAPGWQPWDTAAGLALIGAVGGTAACLPGGAMPDIVGGAGEPFIAGTPAAVASLLAPGIIRPRRREDP
ncbi:MAG: hypothetical protein FJ090_21055 [Deltaproteobacteria bacterium]|nr:hypothetical protein [Deltaproteobacteria bacterium]